MKRNLVLLIVGLVAGLAGRTSAQMLVEPFDYADAAGTQLSAISGWTSTSGNTAVTLQDGNLTGGGITDPVVINNRKVRMTAVNSVHYHSINGAVNSSVYVSFHLNVVALQTTDNYYSCVLALDNDGSVSTSSATGSRQARAGLVVYYQRTSATTYRIGVRKNEGSASNGTTAWGSASFGMNQTVLVVAKYTFGAGTGDDTVALWLNPVSLGGVEDGSPAAPASTTGNSSDSQPIQQVVLLNGSSGNGGGTVEVDNIRVGQAWADVTPSDPVVGSKLGFTTQPVNGAPGATLAQVVVQVQGPTGAAAASNNVPVTLSMTSGSGILSGTLTKNTDATGKAVFDDLSIDTTGVKQLTATASGIGSGLTAATSTTFSIIAQAVATKLAYNTQPADGVVNTTLNGVIVQIHDDNNLPVASNAVPITLTLTSGSGTLNGTVTRNTDNTGKAVFNDLSIDDVGTKQLTASASETGAGLADAVSSTFNITLVPVGAKLAFTTQPSSTPVGATINNLVVQIQDNNSAAVASNGVPITLTLTLGTGTLSGTTTQNTDGTGKATFPGLSINAAGPAKQLTAAASGIGAGLPSTPSAIFAITGTSAASAPVITQTVKTASAVILRGTNGSPGAEYRVLSHTNAGTPVAQWSTVLTNNFNGSGQFNCTNPVSASATRGFFRLLSTASGSEVIDFSHIGFAGRDASGGAYALTGGTNGSSPQDNIVIASNYNQFGAAISNGAPMIILVQGEISMRVDGDAYVKANKTIIGLGTNATLIGCLAMYGNASGGHPTACSNIIIRNLTLRNPDQFGEDDGIVLKYGANHVWVDHCTIYDVYDGALDITRESDFVTVSWCKFFYNSVNSHGDTVNLIGGNDSDSTDLGKLHVTFHHNWWGALCRERMPSVRYGRVHVFNNYFNSVGNHYCSRARLYSELLVENNYFDTVYNPWELATSSQQASNALISAVGNITNNCTFSTSHYDPALPNSGVLILVPGTNTMSSGINQLGPAPYAYTPDAAINVPAKVQANAGAGKGPFAP